MKKRYRLLKEHRINRVLQPAGTEVELVEQLGAWFVENQVAEEVKPPAPEVVSMPASEVSAEEIGDRLQSAAGVATASSEPARTWPPRSTSWGCCSK